jgi:hypothetical protein
MCWITFSSTSSRRKKAPPVPCHRGPRIITIPPEPEMHHRHQLVRMAVPATAILAKRTHKSHHPHENYRHHHPRPDTLRGHGTKRAAPPPPPPPSPTSGRSVHFRPDLRWPWISDPLPRAPRNEAPTYRTVYASPSTVRRQGDTRSATREALRSRDRRPPGRLRRVAGYDVLASEVPWSWECIEEGIKAKRREQRRNYPPFGPLSSWM